MKKNSTLYLLVLLIVMLVLAACGDKESSVEASGEKKVLRVGTSGIYPPFISQGKDGELEGYDVDVLKLVGEELGYEIEWTVAEFAGIFGMMESGKIDTVANLIAATEERREKYDFSSPYAFSGATLVVHEDNDDINGLEDLKGKKLGVLLGNNLHQFAEKWNKENGNEIMITPYQDVSGTYSEIAIGRLDAFIDVKITAASRVKNEGLPLKLYGEEYLYNYDYAFPFVRSAENEEFLKKFSAVIERMLADGTLKELSDKWSAIDVTIQ